MSFWNPWDNSCSSYGSNSNSGSSVATESNQNPNESLSRLISSEIFNNIDCAGIGGELNEKFTFLNDSCDHLLSNSEHLNQSENSFTLPSQTVKTSKQSEVLNETVKIEQTNEIYPVSNINTNIKSNRFDINSLTNNQDAYSKSYNASQLYLAPVQPYYNYDQDYSNVSQMTYGQNINNLRPSSVLSTVLYFQLN